MAPGGEKAERLVRVMLTNERRRLKLPSGMLAAKLIN
jgi:hypothetical protein